MEEWRDIPGVAYEVSSLGRVRNKVTGRILKAWNRSKYLAVNLGIANPFHIHKIVARVFHKEVPGYQIDHINQDKHDNRAENLRWVTSSQNRCNTGCNNRNKLQEKNITKSASGSYCVRIYRDGKYVYIKNFSSLDDAVLARDIFLTTQ